MKIFSRLATKAIGVSEAGTEEYLKGQLDPKAITVNNAVALPRSISDDELFLSKEKWGIKKNDFVFGMMGRFKNDHHKRFSDLIKALSLFFENKQNFKLLWLAVLKVNDLHYLSIKW